MKILMVLAAQNFRDEEYFEPRVIFEDCNATVVTASTSPKAQGSLGAEIEVDQLLTEVTVDDFDGIFFVGGSGSLNYLENPDAKCLAKKFFEARKGIGAICAAPRLLLHWGLLEGKKMTGWNGDTTLEKLSAQNGAFYTGSDVEVDGLFLTADGPGSTKKAGEMFLKLLQNKNE